jgi:hypothetical protein
MSRRRSIAVCVGVGLAVLTTGTAFALFVDTAPVTGNVFTTKTDWTPPTIGTSVIAKTAGGLTGYIKQGGTYYVYANVTDTGNPSGGISSVKANVSTLTTGQTAVTLSSGSFTIGGTTYGYRSASITANAVLTAGSYTYSITATDGGGNSATQSNLPVTVDNTAPSGSDVQTANKTGGTAGLAEIGDTVTFTFSEQIDPETVLAGWTGTSTSVVVRLNNVAGSDTLQIFNAANSTQLPLGTITLGRTDYTSSNRTFGASGTASTMVQSGSAITVTLGTQSGAATTAAATGTMTWTPSASATDRAGNACSVVLATESGSADKEF